MRGRPRFAVPASLRSPRTAARSAGHPYWVLVRVDLKSIVWSRAGEDEADTEEAVWRLGMASGATSGWPGTDWIEDLLLQRHGYEMYETWATGNQPWDRGPVKRAWQEWAAVLANTTGATACPRSTGISTVWARTGTGC
ncbi:hypothetical protein P3L51_04185 [Streptomyces sp. PSRA5]|uniref:hypothetical protein n=1 Tax=Streptomyces panacea TaxID=3035064 RepID=UPI00339D18A1